MTNGTSGDERRRRVRAGLAFSCEGSSDALWAITQFQIRKRFTASELFFGFLAPDKLQDTTVRFSGVDLSPCPGTLVKIRLLASRPTPQNHWSARPFSKIVE